MFAFIAHQSVGDAMGPLLTGMLGASAGQGVTVSLCDQFMQKLVPLVEGILSTELQPSLVVALAASLAETIPHDLEKFVSKTVATELKQRLRPVITESLSQVIPAEIKGETPETLGLIMLRPLVHTLSRSITHSIVPALIHTLTHSASQDYLCYACYHHSQYCNLCHYSSVQVYYGSYYASFYSSYYGDYYSDYYFNYFKNMLFPTYNEPVQTDNVEIEKGS